MTKGTKQLITAVTKRKACMNSCEYWDSESHFCALRRPQAEPVKYGKWVVVDDKPFYECKCSVCGVSEYFEVGWKWFNYCPNCGAKMLNVRCITCIHYEVCGNASMYMDAEKCNHYKEQK